MLIYQDTDDIAPLDMFVKLTEDARQKRQTRIDAGDDTADRMLPRNAWLYST